MALHPAALPSESRPGPAALVSGPRWHRAQHRAAQAARRHFGHRLRLHVRCVQRCGSSLDPHCQAALLHQNGRQQGPYAAPSFAVALVIPHLDSDPVGSNSPPDPHPRYLAPASPTFSFTPRPCTAARAGTSQAAPYVSAAAAIYLMANRANQVTAPQVEAALVASARPLPNLSNGQPLVSTLRSGGGVVDIASLLTNLVDVSPSKLQLATGQAAQTFTFDVFNRGTVALTFRASHRGAASVDSSSLVRVGPQPGTRNNSRTVLPYVPVEADPAVTAVFGNGARNTTQFTIQPRSSTRITVSLAELLLCMRM